MLMEIVPKTDRNLVYGQLTKAYRKGLRISDREEFSMEKRDIVELTEVEIAAVAGGKVTEGQTGIRGLD